MAPSPHRILAGKYRLIRPLDEGGMGSVWLAEHLSLASPVAVKLIASDFGTCEERRQRFLREAHAAAALRSPHVVSTLDYGVDGDTPYIVMELLEGESLAGRLVRLGRLDAGRTELVLRHVSRAVARAHELGIVHRDLKPANIFITRNEEEEIVKIFDFGIAKTEATEDHTSPRTRTGSLLGTPAYMSPEQLEGKRCDHRADIWAMGVIAYECLLGQLPFAGSGLGGLVLAVCTDPLPVPSRHGAVPKGFDEWFLRACARVPEQRFASAREAAHELRRVLTPELLTPELATPLATTERWPGLSCSPPVELDQGASTGASSATIRHRPQRVGRQTLLLASALAGGLTLSALYRFFHPPLPLAPTQQMASLAPAGGATIQAELAPVRPIASAPALVAVPPVAGVGRSSAPAAVRTSETPARAAQRAAPRSLKAHAARPQARSARASFTITSTPPSRVLIDGHPKGTTPLHAVRVRPGTHRVTLIYGKQRKTMMIRGDVGENALISARFSDDELEEAPPAPVD
jgi:serine/threonine-protein kinase